MLLAAPERLKTLPEVEMANGWGEIIKYAMLRDEKLLPLLEGSLNDDVMLNIISTCVAIKRDIVQADEFESGLRALLNLGHTIGHAIERVTHFEMPHGRAVGIGMAVMARGMVRSVMCPLTSCLRSICCSNATVSQASVSGPLMT